MSLLHVNYFSQALGKQSAMFVTVPDGEPPFRVVYLLHGHSDDYTIWQRRTSIERYADEHKVMVAMLDGARSFYTDARDGAFRYEQHVLESVRFVDSTFRTRPEAGARCIEGLSMGGYGAMKLGLKHPDLFGAIVSHSGVLDLGASLSEKSSPEMQLIFGQKLAPDEDCFALAARGQDMPAIRFDCGVDDFLIEHNRRFHAHLDSLDIAHEYEELPGAHTWDFWDRQVQEGLAFFDRS